MPLPDPNRDHKWEVIHPPPEDPMAERERDEEEVEEEVEYGEEIPTLSIGVTHDDSNTPTCSLDS